jgi:murein DD-endopeptidase MepM/ murein hydrolase activator NlpD
MKKLTIVIIPEGTSHTRQVTIPRTWLASVAGLFMLGAFCGGYWIFDYVELKSLKNSYVRLTAENASLKGEARILMSNLDEVKKSLERVKDYSEKLTELTSLKVKQVTNTTGIGPLTEEEVISAKKDAEGAFSSHLPMGLSIDKLTFRPVFSRMMEVGDRAESQAFELGRLLSTLSQQKSLLSSVPATRPAKGWIASGYGKRVSPFTGRKTMHLGIDFAAPIGTPIFAPADGVVIFSGKKSGFGNFIMIAHGYGIVTRYGHNAQNMVQPGQRLKRGDQIATVGNTGRTTGPHLHYEVMVNGQTVNPKKFILDFAEDL